MSTPVEPPPVQWGGETAANFYWRQLDYQYRTGGGGTGPNPTMAKQWTSQHVTQPAPSGFDIK